MRTINTVQNNNTPGGLIKAATRRTAESSPYKQWKYNSTEFQISANSHATWKTLAPQQHLQQIWDFTLNWRLICSSIVSVFLTTYPTEGMKTDDWRLNKVLLRKGGLQQIPKKAEHEQIKRKVRNEFELSYFNLHKQNFKLVCTIRVDSNPQLGRSGKSSL